MNYVGYKGRRNEVLVCTFAHVQRIDHVSERETDVVAEQGVTKNPVHNGSEGFKHK